MTPSWRAATLAWPRRVRSRSAHRPPRKVRLTESSTVADDRRGDGGGAADRPTRTGGIRSLAGPSAGVSCAYGAGRVHRGKATAGHHRTGRRQRGGRGARPAPSPGGQPGRLHTPVITPSLPADPPGGHGSSPGSWTVAAGPLRTVQPRAGVV